MPFIMDVHRLYRERLGVHPAFQFCAPFTLATLVRGFLRRLGHEGPVKSPTYTLIEPYRLAHRNCYHLDLYRVSDPEELEYLGLRDLLGEESTLLVEWPERGAGWLPEPDLLVAIAYAPPGRRLAFSAESPVGARVLAALGSLE